MTQRDEDRERLRAQLIVAVRSGQISAKQAAARLGVSRKTYYKWEKRALKGMVEALSERVRGRAPAALDREKQALREKTERLEKTVEALERSLRIREQLKGLLRDRADSRTEKKA